MHNIHCSDDTHVHVGFTITLCGEHNEHRHAHTQTYSNSPPHKASTQFSLMFVQRLSSPDVIVEFSVQFLNVFFPVQSSFSRVPFAMP